MESQEERGDSSGSAPGLAGADTRALIIKNASR
jgi:hypothetical protein